MLDGSELAPGTLLGAYRIVRRIGAGGMGAVYEAEHRELNKRVAIKTPYSEAGLSPEGRARFVQEGRTVSRIRHPHVVDITDVGELDDVAYLVMEYLEGETFSALIKREGPLPARIIADIIVPVASALHVAHERGVIHRDLKPDNIFLTRSVQGNIHPKVLDFGISKVLGDGMSPRLTNTNTILGTPSYVSPEQLEAAHLTTPASDQYSLGVVMYEAATGQNPFARHTTLVSMINAVVKGQYRRPFDINPQVDERLARIALRAMSVSPKARFPSMAVLGAELLPLASADTMSTWTRYLTPSSATTPLSHAIVRRPRPLDARIPWVIAAGGLTFLAAAAFIRTHRPRPDAARSVEVRQALEAPAPGAAASPRAEPPATEPRAELAPATAHEPAPSVSGVSDTAARDGNRAVSRQKAGGPVRPQPAVKAARTARAGTPATSRHGEHEASAGPSVSERPPATPASTTSHPPPRRGESPAARAKRDAAERSGEALQTDNVDPWAP